MAGSDQDDVGPGDDSSQYQGDASGQMHPALTDFINKFQTDEGKGWAQAAAGRVQDFMTTRAIAQQNQAAGDAFVNNLHDTKMNLTGMVQKDPSTADLALDLAPGIVKGLAGDEHGDEVTGPIIDHMQGEIAHSAVQRYAELDHGLATDALDRYSSYIPEDQQTSLRNYAGMQQALRTQDAQAQQLQQTRDAAVAGYQNATGWLGKLADDNGDVHYDPNYSSKLMADQGVAMETKLALHAAYQVLQQSGGTQQSDPAILSSFISRIGDPNVQSPQQGELIAHVGSGLSLPDAQYLNGMLAPSNPQQRASMAQLADVTQQAKEMIASPANGAGGQVAYGRFMQYMMSSLHGGGNVGDLLNDNRLQQFAPTADDVRQSLPVGPRLPLTDIFGDK